MTYKTEFPDFADMPQDVPAAWQDSSWHNDVCPSLVFMAAGMGDSNFEFARVWIAESDPAEREYPESKRFLVTYENGANCDCLGILATDNWQEVKSYAEIRRKLAEKYIETIGHNPFLDDPTLDPWEVAESLYVSRRFAMMETAP